MQPCSVTAPTENTSGARAGYASEVAAELPAAPTTSTPWRSAKCTALRISGMSRAVSPRPNSNERLMTWAWWRVAKRMPAAIVGMSPSPTASSTRTGMIFAP